MSTGRGVKMSLIIFSHSPDFIVVAADRRVTADRGGRLVRVGSAPKFVILGRSIIAALGRLKHTASLLSGAIRFATDHPTEDIVSFLQSRAIQLWENRPPSNDALAQFDGLGVFAGAFDARSNRMRFVALTNENNFEVTEQPAGISPAGFVSEIDFPLLQELADTMATAKKKEAAWIAAALRDTGNEIARRHSDFIDAMTDFAALGRDGVIDLGSQFPLPSRDISMEVFLQ